jgi:hypothetical protein
MHTLFIHHSPLQNIHHSSFIIIKILFLCFPFWLRAMSTSSTQGDSSVVPCEHARLLLKKNTLIPLRVAGTVDGDKVQTSSIVRLTVEKSIGENDITFINPGRFAQARLTVTSAGRFGRPGKIRLEPMFVETVDGQLIELSGGVLEWSGKNDLKHGIIGTSAAMPIIGLALGTPWMLPFVGIGFFIKGREAVLPTDAYIVAKVKHDVYICP